MWGRFITTFISEMLEMRFHLHSPTCLLPGCVELLGCKFSTRGVVMFLPAFAMVIFTSALSN